MADTDNPVIIVDTDGVNEIEIGSKATLSVIEVGKTKELRVATTSAYKKPVKWVWIATEYLEEAKKMQIGQKFDKWGEWKSKNATEPIDKYGIGKQYVFGNAINTKTSKKDLTEGTIYYFEPFIDYPTLDRGTYIATINKPKILSAYFARYKDEFKYPGESGTSNIYTYKNTIKLYILGHMLPDYTVGYHNFALFEVEIWDSDGNKTTKEPLKYFQKYHPDKFSVNTMTELDFVIDEKWRDNSEHKKDTVKTYYAKIKTTLYANEDAFAGEDVDNIKDDYLITANENPRNNHKYLKFTNKFKSVAPNLDTIGVIYTSEDEAVSQSGWFGRNTDKGKTNAKKYKKILVEEYDTTKGTVLKDQQASFDVKYDTMDVILDKYEADKNNMMVVVGDAEYTAKSNEPCKFSKIEITHKSRKKPFILFDENKTTPTVIDQTNLAFGIVAGDTKEKITITAVGLAIQNYQDKGLKKPQCYGITTAQKVRKGRLERKKVKHKKEEEFKHNNIEDVFSMEKAYVLYPEGTPQETTGSETLDISGQQIKYEHKDNGVELEVGYLYNKTFDTSFESIVGAKIGEWTNDLVDKAWILRYFLLKDNQAQSYFVPISTCRYPNQMAIIKVYPNINWGITFSFGDINPKYKENWHKSLDEKKQKLIKEYKERVKPFNRNKPITVEEEKKKKALKKLKLSLGIKASYGTESMNLTPGLGQKVDDFVYAFAKAKNLIDTITGNESSKEEQNTLYQKRVHRLAEKHGKKWLKKLAKAPITITVHQPTFAIGFAWGRETLVSNISAATPIKYDIFLKADPLFKLEGSLDLITCATFIPVAGQVIKVADMVLNVVGVTPVFKLTAMGSISLAIQGTIKKAENINESKLQREIKAGLKMSIEASVTVGGGLVGFMFAGGDIKGAVTESTYTAYAETGFELALSPGVSAHKGIYNTVKLEFLGLIAVGKKETKFDDYGGNTEELFRYTIVEKTTFVDKTFYFA